MNTFEHASDCRGAAELMDRNYIDAAHLTRTAAAIGTPLNSHLRPDDLFLVHIVAGLTSGTMLADEIAEQINLSTDRFDPYGHTARLVHRCLITEGLLLNYLSRYFEEFPAPGRTAEASAKIALRNAIIANQLASEF